jgi:hypothetical protein
MIAVLSFVNPKFAARENRCSLFQFQRIVRPWPATSFIFPKHFFGTPRLPPQELHLRSKFGLRSSRFAKPFGPACGTLSPRRPGAPVQPSASPKLPRSGKILICASPPALHPSGQPAVDFTPGRPAFCFTPWPVKCEAYFTGLR